MKTNRRGFMKAAAWAGGLAGMLAQPGCAALSGFSERKGKNMAGFRAEPLERVRVGIIGTGSRGSGFVKRLADIPGVEVKALCDVHEDRVASQVRVLTEKGRPAPAAYFGSRDVWRKLCESKEIDVVYVVTPWLLHTPMAVYAMQCGKHAAVEVPAAMTVEQCWQLVDAAEAARRHCMILENCCYGENELLALNLCRKGVLGDLIHGEAAYIHDCRSLYLAEDAKGGTDGQWRLEWLKQHTGNAYPTHGLGPVCQYMDVNRGDRMEVLTSMSSAPLGLGLAAADKFGKGSPQAKAAYKMGNMNTSLIRTYRGRTIMVQFDTLSPRPYSRLNLISGTKGVLADFPLRAALEPKAHAWMDDKALEALKAKYAHPLWDKNGAAAKAAGGHGGVDYMMDLRLSHCLRNGLPLDIDVYDTALWSSLVELSERSVLRGGAPVEVPDFTRGGWKTADPLGIVTM